MMSGARTAGMSQTAYSASRSTGKTRLRGSNAVQARPQAQNTTPNATPITATMRMSRVRHGATATGWVGAAVWARSIVVMATASFQVRTTPTSGRRTTRRAWACFLRRYEPDQVPRVCGWGHTLSARALPGGGLQLPGDGTAATLANSLRGRALIRNRCVHPTRALPDPVDHVAHHGRAGRLVVPLVAELGIDAARDAGTALEDVARGGRDDPVGLALEDQRRDGQSVDVLDDAALLGEPGVGEPDGRLVLVERVDRVGLLDRRVAREVGGIEAVGEEEV